MNRTLRRPMFRMGGSAEGITSGLSMPRQGYKDAKLVEVPEEKGAPISQDLIDAGIFRTGGPKKNSADVTKSNTTNANSESSNKQTVMDLINERRNIMDALAPRAERKDTSFNDFLINFGLDLLNRPKQGKGVSGFLSTAAASAQAPFAAYQQAQQIEDAYKDKQTTEDRNMISEILNNMDEDDLSAMMKKVEAGVAAGYYKDKNEGIIRQLQKEEYGVMDMPGEEQNARIKELERMIIRDQEVPAGMVNSVAQHIYKIETGGYPEDIQKDLNKTKTYIKPNHVAGVKKDEAGDVVEIILDANFSSTYQPNQIYYDAQTGNLFKNIGKQGEAPRFIKVEY